MFRDVLEWQTHTQQFFERMNSSTIIIDGHALAANEIRYCEAVFFLQLPSAYAQFDIPNAWGEMNRDENIW
jgi:hypothetical protein